MNQDQLALSTGVGRRFLIDLEAGKPSCQIGRSLVVAQALGLDIAGVPTTDAVQGPDLPPMNED